MDEAGVRALLECVADDPAPPSRVDIAAARQRGRRRIRRRRAALAAAPLAAAAAVALVVSGVIPASLGLGRGGLPAGPQTARGRFSPLVPYAAFGWLPPGFSAAAGTAMTKTTDESGSRSVMVTAGDQAAGRLLGLTVAAAGACRVTGPVQSRTQVSTSGPRAQFRTVRYRHGLSCDYGYAGSAVTPLSRAAPSVRGGAAFYSPDGGLAWQYAPDSWAQLTPWVLVTGGGTPRQYARLRYLAAEGWAPGSAYLGSPAPVQSAGTRALLREVAARVSFGRTARIVFPFRLPALPASWAVSGAGYTVSGGRLLGTGYLTAGPAADPGALIVQAERAGLIRNCRVIPGQWSRTRIQRAPAAMRTLDDPGQHVQQVCAEDVAGLYLWLSLDRDVPRTSRPVPGGAGLGGAVQLASRLRLLGANPAAWTTDPLG